MGEDRKNLIIVAGTQFLQLLERKKKTAGAVSDLEHGSRACFGYSFYTRGPPALGKAQERSFPMKRRKISSWI